MWRPVLYLCVSLTVTSSRASAANDPSIAPVPEWVQHLDIPSAKAPSGERPFQPLLSTIQEYFTKEGSETYTEFATRIENAQGLQAMGTIVIPWKPDRSELMIHKLEIIRGGKVENVLANQKFAVLRRENNLDSATLDGILTAVIQPEGLSVGDVVHLAYTQKTSPDPLGLKPASIVILQPGVSTTRVYFREVWQADQAMRWHASPAMGTPKTGKSRFGTELVLDLHEVEGPKGLEGAPPRYAVPAVLELTEYASWKDLSAAMAPLYEKASQFAPSSPLQEEVRRIAGTTPDPKQRALAALKLVQDKIRYVALLMGDGGYLPAPADQSWSRKFGDCKGKTAILLALLKNLGINAEPILVSTRLGDGVADQLPMAEIFNHVIVRARIEGHDYWLDGARQGDVDLDSVVQMASLGWTLPVRTGGAELERVSYRAPALPLIETNVTYDASGGIFLPVQVRGEIIYRGDIAKLFTASLGQLGKEEFLKKIRESKNSIPENKATQLDVETNAANGALTIAFSSRENMDWSESAAGKIRKYRFDDETIAWTPEFKRDRGALADAPFQLEIPVYLAATETIILPQKGTGFSIEGKNLDQTTAGTRISRTLSLTDGKAVAHSTFIRIQPEITAAEAKSSEGPLKLVNNDSAFVRAPDGYKIGDSEKKALLDTPPVDAYGYLLRGYYKLEDWQVSSALADFDQAIVLDPANAEAHARRGMALVILRKFAEAQKAIDQAIALDPNNQIVIQARGELRMAMGKPEEAAADFARSSEGGQEADPYALMQHANASLRLGKLADADADLTELLKVDPNNPDALMLSSAVAIERGDTNSAVAALDNALKLNPSDPKLLGLKGEVLKQAGRTEGANKAYASMLAQVEVQLVKAPKARPPVLDGQTAELLSMKAQLLAEMGDYRQALAVADAALAIQPDNVRMLNTRCYVRVVAQSELDKASIDCDTALRDDPGSTKVLETRGLLSLRRKLWDKAIADFDEIIRALPELPTAYYGRGLAKLGKGDRDGGSTDLAAAKRYDFATHLEFDQLGLKP
jgi:tetratricopeptide (TPR) repeat protein